MKRVKAVLLVVSMAGVSACLRSEIVVTVRPDGSGTIERTAELRPNALAALQRLLPPDPSATPLKPPPAFMQPPGRVGTGWNPGLRVRSSRSLNSATTLGWTVIYEFDDLTMLDVELLPRDLGLDVFNGLAVDSLTNTRVKFALEPLVDGTERLTVHFPRFALDPSLEPPAGWASGPASDMAALRSVLQGSRITVSIQTEQPLLRTNSPHYEGNRVTLLDVDAEQALFSRQIGMLATTPASFDELLWAFGDLPGVTLARDHDVTLEFQDPAALTAGSDAPQPPETEIFLAPLTRSGGEMVVGTPVNISKSTAFDGDPSFTPDGRSVLFASSRRGAIDEGVAPEVTRPPSQTDIYRYDIAPARVSRVTRTPNSEYSPAVMPDGAHISVVRVERDGRRRLWSYGIDGGSPAVLLPGITPVGGHAWIDDRTVALFVAGGGVEPSTLQVADIRNGSTRVVASGVGLSVQRMPSGQISFVQHQAGAGGAPAASVIKRLDRPRGPVATSMLIGTVDGAAAPELAWMPDGTLLTANNGKLYRWRPGDLTWKAIADLHALGVRDVTRLAVSPSGDRLALAGRAN